MTGSPHPVAMFKLQETPHGTSYWPANSFAVDLCGIAGLLCLREDRMHYVRKRFRVVAPSGKPLPHPVKKVDEWA